MRVRRAGDNEAGRGFDVAMNVGEREALEALIVRLKAILPEEYQDSYESVQPVSMGSAGLKYGLDGKVAWNEMWATFCDLAMAGGPPHKGTLLEPGSAAEIVAQPDRYDEVVDEICRGVNLVTDLPVERSPMPGWVRVRCLNGGMASWLVRAIVMENVSARSTSNALDLPAAPGFRIEKEIKNVITVIAKTCHYWLGHIPRPQQRAIADLFLRMAEESPLVEPALRGDAATADHHDDAATRIAEGIQQSTGLGRAPQRYTGWLGVECPSVRAAVWMMRALVVSNVLSRREGTVLFVPVNPMSDPGGRTVVAIVSRVHRFAAGEGVL
jgi:sirohydrochlorin cobaltochelatase